MFNLYNLRELSVDEYLAEEKEYTKQHYLYLDKLAEINRQENILIDSLGGENIDWDAYRNSNASKAFEEKREELKEQFGRASSLYASDFYCKLTEDNLNKLVRKDSANFNSYLEKIKKLTGKRVKTEFGDEGVCLGLATTIDDIYYIVKRDGKDKPFFITTCLSLKLADE